MQNLPRVMILRCLALIAPLLFADAAMASLSCAEVHRRASETYLRELEKLTQSATEAKAISGGAGALFIACAGLSGQIIPCGLVFGGAALVYWLYGTYGVESLEPLANAHRIYLVYSQAQSGGGTEVREFADKLGGDAQAANEALGELVRKMDAGELCRRGRPAVGYDRLLNDLRSSASER